MTKEQKIYALTSLVKKAHVQRNATVTYAYAQGFCKTAEAAGLNPVELIKMAGWWDDVKDWTSAAVTGTKDALKEHFIDGKFYKNLWTNTKRLGTGFLQGVGKTVNGAGNLLAGAGSFLTGQGWSKGWNSDWVNNLGLDGYTLGDAQRRMKNWQAQLRNEYIERNNINLSRPDSLNWADKLALFGADLSETAGRAAGEQWAGNRLMGLAGRFGGQNIKAFTDWYRRGTSNVGSWGGWKHPFRLQLNGFGALGTGLTTWNNFSTNGNWNRQYQDLNPVSNSIAGTSQNYYNAVNPGDISGQMKWEVG